MNKQHAYPKPSAAGYSLLELILVLAIIASLLGFLLPRGFDALRNARVQQVGKAIDTLKTALADFVMLPGGNGSIPRTEGTGVPTSGPALTGSTDIAKGNAARLDAVLLATGKIERPLSLRMGSQVYTSTGTGGEIHWNQALAAFTMTPDGTPQRNWNAVTRVEARSSAPLTLPSAALGANFRLDGVNDLKANLVVAYLVIVGVPAKDAYDLAVQLNGPQLAPMEGSACDTGQIAYAAPSNGLTDVYIYLASV